MVLLVFGGFSLWRNFVLTGGSGHPTWSRVGLNSLWPNINWTRYLPCNVHNVEPVISSVYGNMLTMHRKCLYEVLETSRCWSNLLILDVFVLTVENHQIKKLSLPGTLSSKNQGAVLLLSLCLCVRICVCVSVRVCLHMHTFIYYEWPFLVCVCAHMHMCIQKKKSSLIQTICMLESVYI